jgi:hypothetical protein
MSLSGGLFSIDKNPFLVYNGRLVKVPTNSSLTILITLTTRRKDMNIAESNARRAAKLAGRKSVPTVKTTPVTTSAVTVPAPTKKTEPTAIWKKAENLSKGANEVAGGTLLAILILITAAGSFVGTILFVLGAASIVLNIFAYAVTGNCASGFLEPGLLVAGAGAALMFLHRMVSQVGKGASKKEDKKKEEKKKAPQAPKTAAPAPKAEEKPVAPDPVAAAKTENARLKAAVEQIRIERENARLQAELEELKKGKK